MQRCAQVHAGVVDDGGTTSPFISGIVLTTTVGASEATTPDMLNFPQVALYATRDDFSIAMVALREVDQTGNQQWLALH